jgi:hypothetical protein
MKYPVEQLKVLQDSLLELSKHFELRDMYPSNLHYTVFVQGSEGQTHNWLYINRTLNKITYQHKIEDFTGWEKLFEVPNSFLLYPDGCNDDHIETAVKHCLKSIII